MKRPKSRPAGKKYRYVVEVVEEVKSSTAIESDRKLPWSRLKAIAESRRIHGKLSLVGVGDVDMYCTEAYLDGVKEASA